MKKIAMISLGCPKNLVDSEMILGSLNKIYAMTDDTAYADFIIVNTCGFIESAKQESIEAILDACENRKDNTVKVIVTGCLAQRYQQELKDEIPEIDAIVGIGDIASILKIIDGDNESSSRNENALNGSRYISTGKGFAYLRISDGCDNRCTYCAIPSIRGPYVSRPFEEIIDEAKMLADAGIKEIVLIAQDTTYYGMDIYAEKRLSALIEEISKISHIKWIRLLYAYPEQIDEALIAQFRDNDKLVKYIDMPIQHISDAVLKGMGRRGTSRLVKDVIASLRKNVPGMVIRTTFIVAFPGETDDDFMQLCSFVKKEKFERIGVFTYSREDGTPAAKMKGQIRKAVKQQRYDILMQLAQKISSKKNLSRMGKKYDVMIEGVSEDGLFYHGRTYAEAPEIDPKVYFTSQEPLEVWEFANIKILNTEEYDIVGAVNDEFTK